MPLTEPQERRREPRALTAAIVRVIDEYGDPSHCVIEDLSNSGALLHTDLEMSVGTLLKLEVGSICRSGVVRHCSADKPGFTVGISFTGEGWPEPIQLPVHWIPTVERQSSEQ